MREEYGQPLWPEDLRVNSLGAPTVNATSGPLRYVNENDRVLAFGTTAQLSRYTESGLPLPAFEKAGPREQLFFDPAKSRAGVVTCGGLCPGQNDVIRSLVLTLHHTYGVPEILGFRYGYAGVVKDSAYEPFPLTLDFVSRIHTEGGTVLGSSRGPQSPEAMVEGLLHHGVNMLFTIGGDGTLRGAEALCGEIRRRKLPIAVVGIPKTIDNDLLWTERSFGFATAVEEARRAIMTAHTEARGSWNGIGIVRLMGRHSGFIAAHASLANNDVNFCFIPEVGFDLDGSGAFLEVLEQRLKARRHAVVVVAEGAGQDLVNSETAEPKERDPSGNVRLHDIGRFMKDRLTRHFNSIEMPVTIKYIDPSYMVRSLAANSFDSEYCLTLAQNAVHAAMAGRTNVVVAYWNQHFTHVPIKLAVSGRRQVDPRGDVWQAVLGATGQPASMRSKPRG